MTEKDNDTSKQSNAKEVQFETFEQKAQVEEGFEIRNLDLVRDVKMNVSVELGRIYVPLGKLLQISKGSVIELDKSSDEPVDILVNGRMIARGTVVVVNDNFAVRVSEIVTGQKSMSVLLEP